MTSSKFLVNVSKEKQKVGSNGGAEEVSKDTILQS